MRIVDERGLSEVIGFILILALLVVILSLYNLYVVPAQGREDEIAHMNDIRERFTAYKWSMDALWMNAPDHPAVKAGTYGVTISTPLILGTTGQISQGGLSFLPVLAPVGSSGAMIIDGDDGTITVTRNDAETLINVSLGSVRYASSNNYWVQQDYYYQMGGVFLSQDSGVVNRISPDLSIYNISNTAAISIVPIQINGDQYIAGSGGVRLDSRLRFMPQYFENAQEAQKIRVEVAVRSLKEAEAWERVFADTAVMNNVPSSWYTTGYSGDESMGRAFVEVEGPDSGTDMDVRVDIIRADFNVHLQNVATEIS